MKKQKSISSIIDILDDRFFDKTQNQKIKLLLLETFYIDKNFIWSCSDELLNEGISPLRLLGLLTLMCSLDIDPDKIPDLEKNIDVRGYRTIKKASKLLKRVPIPTDKELQKTYRNLISKLEPMNPYILTWKFIAEKKFNFEYNN